jgi:hypothetical protein
MWFFANALEGSQEFPVNASTATGTVIVKYNSTTNVLELTGDYQNLNATISGSHIHGPAGPGANAGVLFVLNNSGGTTGTLSGTFTLTEPQEADLLAGNMYANVHSTGTYGAGEIRAQLLPTSMSSSYYINGFLEADQSVATPAVVSSGTGTVTTLLDRQALKIYLTGSFSGLTSNITNAHIHGGIAGTNGPVLIPLLFAGTTSGTVTGTATVRSTFADSVINGLTYVNIHTGTYGAGEIRAQLANLVLPVKLQFFNAFKDRDKIAVVWESNAELNLNYYEVQQQDPTTSQWITKKSVTALNSSSVSKYRYDDVPLSGVGNYVYYRLRMVDKDGRYTYSQVIRINRIQMKAELILQSNPIRNGQLQYMITGLPTNKKAAVSIVDYGGKVLVKTSAFTLANNSIAVGRLSPGMYKLLVQIDDVVLKQTFLR